LICAGTDACGAGLGNVQRETRTIRTHIALFYAIISLFDNKQIVMFPAGNIICAGLFLYILCVELWKLLLPVRCQL
jgi:hypothetical protein